MAALVQSFPSPSSTITMLQARPSSSDAFQSGSQSHQQHQRSPTVPRNMYNTPVGGMASGNYRGHTSTAPVSPYAFTSTPVTSNGGNPLRQHPATPHLRQENRTTSAPVMSFTQPMVSSSATTSDRPRLPAVSTAAPLDLAMGSKDDASIASPTAKQNTSRPLSSTELNSPSLPTPPSFPATNKPSPDRYRRNNRRPETQGSSTATTTTPAGSALPSGSGMATVGHLYNVPTQSSSIPALSTYPLYRRSQSPLSQSGSDGSSATLISSDDMNIHKPSTSEQAKRYRRRSISSLEAKEYTSQTFEAPAQPLTQPKTYAAMLAGPAPQERKEARVPAAIQRPGSSHGRQGSTESTSTGHSTSRPPSTKKEGVAAPTPTALQATPIAKNEAKIVNIPPRGSSDGNKRLTNPSPLSRPTPMSPETPSNKNAFVAAVQSKSNSSSTPQIGIPESPAAQHLAALNKKDAKKEGKPSRLRRAFSFGSAAELRKASAENNMNNNASAERAKLRKDRYQDEREAEQAAIVQKQEAGGLGEGIYSGQGHFFTGSTDNLSISSTASSASVMIRKMGKGMKKGSRSLVGLFRPKSVVGVPTTDSTVPEPSVAQVSMVTVEAEREKVNVNADPHEQVKGGTGFPKLERNSIDAANAGLEAFDAQHDFNEVLPGRQSIVGGEKERAEVLAAVKKGILKRSGTDSGNSSPVVKPLDKPTYFDLPHVPHLTDSPRSSSPTSLGEGNNARLGHRRTDSVNLDGEEYFMNVAANFAGGDSKSMPGTPRSNPSRNISFSPRIQFHDTWTSGEYDRRGEIATCNRLTPMLAQQIKEELNTFKMEMEVHEQSKVHTHFF